MALYISNGTGVNSIEDSWPIPAGWSVIDATEAAAKAPALFGAPTDEFGRVVGPIPTEDVPAADAPAAKASK